MILDDGLSRGVVDIELFSHIDDGPAVLDAPQQLRPCLLSHLLIVLGGSTQGHKDGLKRIADYFNGGFGGVRKDCSHLGTHG